VSSRRYDVVGTGSMVVDRIASVPRVIGSDEKVLLSPDDSGRVVRELVGGVTLNHLGWARVLGMRVGIFGKQADDREGRLLRDGMDRLGIEHHMDLSGAASSFAQVYVDPTGARSIYMARGATGELSAEDIDGLHRPVVESATFVTSEVSQVPLAAVKRCLELARAAGATTVLDLDVPVDMAVPGLGSEAELHAVLGLADVLKPSLSAAAGLIGASEPEAVARGLAERYGVSVVALTLGEQGSLLLADGELERAPTESLRAIDTTGAGDAFLGGLLAGRHHGLGWRDAALLGNACGAACCERIGAFPDDPETCRARVLELYARLGGAAFELPAWKSASQSTDALENFLKVAAGEVERAAECADRGALRAAADLIREAERAGGRVHVTGIGKPEHVARYAASLLSSVGTPAAFLHGTEATHGSVGQLREGDVVIAISNSGSTPELLGCVQAAAGMGARLIAVTGEPESELAKRAEVVLVANVQAEGGPLDLAPRASILAETLVLAALSVVLQDRKGLDEAEYQRRHPGGALGERTRG